MEEKEVREVTTGKESSKPPRQQSVRNLARRFEKPDNSETDGKNFKNFGGRIMCSQ